MACSACSAHVERKLNSLKGVNEASVSLATRTALVDYNPKEISLEDMTNIEKIHDITVLRLRMENSRRLISSTLRPVSMTRS